ncbi:TolC family protein [Aureisphaera galaxeae]|uniref:TolC family protein n=1 Tax=Aureisphaera galaxeae TaxID=1538023 RepID=UPI0023509DA0|nr:TolC family protein [Aureisphaera galaxeae]MDC8004279.1 TolC family protein [Aureisphaera galaxeae]
MMRFVQHLLLLIFLASSLPVLTQSQSNVLSYEEYIGYLKEHHPIMKQANLRLTEGEATLLKARGGFDPKIEVDYDRKEFKGTEYWDILNTTFKIPTWYGLEFRAGFEQNTGNFLNRQLSGTEDGLYSAGVSLDLGKGFVINERMANLKKAKFFREQTKADRDVLLNNLIFEATKAYLDWMEAYNEERIYDSFLNNALQRFEGVKVRVNAGDIAAIDSTEARITYRNRLLNLEAARLKRLQKALKASTFLWLEDVPLEIQENVIPEMPSMELLETSLNLINTEDIDALIASHPKLRSMDEKIKGLEVDRSLKRNKLLPTLRLEYNFLTEETDNLNTINTGEYKGGLTFRLPLFLRKERGDVRLANVKLNGANLDRMNTSLVLQNKIVAANQEVSSLERQRTLITDIVTDYRTLVSAEERKFELGESSLFLINSREQKLIEASLKENNLQIKSLKALAKLYNAIGISI